MAAAAVITAAAATAVSAPAGVPQDAEWRIRAGERAKDEAIGRCSVGKKTEERLKTSKHFTPRTDLLSPLDDLCLSRQIDR